MQKRWSLSEFIADIQGANHRICQGLNPFEAGGKESVEPRHAGIRVWPVARQRPQLARRRDEFLKRRKFDSCDRFATDSPVLFSHCGNNIFAFLRFQGTSAVHNCAA
jgi:hypothetical protein